MVPDDHAVIVDAVRRVSEGGSAIDPDVVAQLLGRRREATLAETLTPRELEVLALMAEGRTNANIAAEIVVTIGAVEKHVASIFGKLRLPQTDAGGHRRVLAVLAWLQAQP